MSFNFRHPTPFTSNTYVGLVLIFVNDSYSILIILKLESTLLPFFFPNVYCLIARGKVLLIRDLQMYVRVSSSGGFAEPK